ncbi:MAG: hypothetical protein IKZ26_03100 [Peptococcaceae bacterium]|nr:hypothetical protein [Peptococcaceae bacterium]
MDEQVLRYREAKLMEPIYRMFKVIEQEDVLKAQTLMSVTMQYIIEHFGGKNLTPADVQQILRAVLLNEEDGRYYAMYVYNEIQVKTAGWLTVLAVDCPVTLEALGGMAEQIAEALKEKDFITLSAAEVLDLLEQIAGAVDGVLLERLQLNRQRYLAELKTFLVQ